MPVLSHERKPGTRTHFDVTDALRGNRRPGGTRRFSDLQRLTPDVTHKMLTSTLRQLESAGLVDRRVYPEVPPRVEYSLSDHGRSVRPVIEAVRTWGHQHLRHKGQE